MFSDRYFEGFSNENFEDVVIRFQYGINAGVVLFIDEGLVTGFYEDSDGIIFGFNNILRFLIM